MRIFAKIPSKCVVITEKQMKETLDTSYRSFLHREITQRIKDWDYSNPWDEDIEKSNLDKLSRKLHKDKSNFNVANGGKDTGIWTELEKLGFIKLHYQTLSGDDAPLDYYMIEKDKFNQMKGKFQSILNFFNYKCVKMINYDGNDFGYDIDGIRVTLEPVFTREINSKERIFYHATPDRNVNKILKQGLVPKDRGQLGVKRPERIYLSPYIDISIVKRFERDNEQEYTILKVDLTSQPNIKLYEDKLYKDEAYYCVSYIPPSCISVLPEQPHKIAKVREAEIHKWMGELCDSLGLNYHGGPFGGTIVGENNGLTFDLRIGIYMNFNQYICQINGKIQKPNKNGKIMTSRWYTNGYVSFKGQSHFRYEDVKPLMIDKYIKRILMTGSKSGLAGV